MLGKILGALLGLFLTRRISGLIMGAIAGHIFIDKGSRSSRSSQGGGFGFRGFNIGSTSTFHRQDLFYELFFTLLGKLALADGKVSEEETSYIEKLLDNMKIQGPYRYTANQYFKAGQTNSSTIQDLAQQFLTATQQQPQLRTQLMYQLVGLASADKIITSEERAFLEEIAKLFKISETELEHQLASFGAQDNKLYHILGVNANASDEEVRAAYRKNLKEYHPDILKSKGLPPSMEEFAKKRFYDIQNAWSQIKTSRNLKD